MREWRNGSRGRLKPCCPKGRVSSNLTPRTNGEHIRFNKTLDLLYEIKR